MTSVAIGVALGTFVLEDAAILAAAGLILAGKLTFELAYVALFVGIAGGDVALYGLGRLAAGHATVGRLLRAERLATSTAWVRAHGAQVVVLARFIPGARLPTYLAAGLIQLNLWRFVATVAVLVAAWTAVLLWVATFVGQAVAERVGQLGWVVGVVLALLLLVLIPRWVRRRLGPSAAATPTTLMSAPAAAATRGIERPPTTGREAPNRAGARAYSSFEFAPPWLFYLPMVVYGLWLGLRFRGFTLPTVANPSIYAGGMVMESKSEILALMPDDVLASVARWFLDRADAEPAERLRRILKRLAMGDAGGWPTIIKPDRGQRGDGVKLARQPEDLRAYLESAPGIDVIVQEFVAWSGEAGIFYVRYPNEEHGRIFSLTLKEFPRAVGDGRRTLRELIDDHPRWSRQRRVFFNRHRATLEEVVPRGTLIPLVQAGNHCQGAVFRNGASWITPALEASIDAIARKIPGFYFGRFDVRFESLDELGAGRRFRIIELNGASAEATHIWDPNESLWNAYRTLMAQYRHLYAIAAMVRDRGSEPLSLFRVLDDLRTYRMAAAHYPATD